MSDVIYKLKKSEADWKKLPFTHIQNGYNIHTESIEFEKHNYEYISLIGKSRVVSGYYKCKNCRKEKLLFEEDTKICSIPKYYYLAKANVDPIGPLCSQDQFGKALEKSIKNIKSYIKKVQKIIHVPYVMIQGKTSIAAQAISFLLRTNEIELYSLPKSPIEYIKLK